MIKTIYGDHLIKFKQLNEDLLNKNMKTLNEFVEHLNDYIENFKCDEIREEMTLKKKESIFDRLDETIKRNNFFFIF